ncbi:MAG: transposase [Candidatus Pacebacteria bacterium]|nr:transposase [Candidatus Paceibacterota bacterium]
MSIRKVPFVNGEYYHIYNRGVDKRYIFKDKSDVWRFIKGILLFNKIDNIGSIQDALKINTIHGSLASVDYKKLIEQSGGLVEIVAICLNPNHYHLLAKQISDNGVSKFMHKLGTGYTKHINEKENRNGSLFQGKFKAKLIETNQQLLYTSAYINLNYEIHGITRDDLDLVFSSWDEYAGKNKTMNICKGKNIILDQFSDFEDYEKFARDVVEKSKQLKEDLRNEHLE